MYNILSDHNYHNLLVELSLDQVPSHESFIDTWGVCLDMNSVLYTN